MRTSHWVAFPTVLLGALWAHAAYAGPYRSASIHWRIPNPIGAPLTTEVTVDQAWQATSPGCVEVAFGDGSTSQACPSAFDVGGGVDPSGSPFVVRRYVATHTYATSADTTLSLGDCCRMPGLVNGSGASYRVASRVSFANGNTAGPVTETLPVVGLVAGGVRHYDFPALDADGDPVSCRLATDAEAGFVGSTPTLPADGQAPVVSSGKGTCHLEWDLTNASAGDRFVVHLVLESGVLGSTSSAEADLMTEIVADPLPTCAGGGTFTVPIGQTFSSSFAGFDPSVGALSLSAVGASQAELGIPLGQLLPSPTPATFQWTPSTADAGTTRIVLASFTNELMRTGTCTLAVQVPSCVGWGSPCSVGQGQCRSFGLITCQNAEAVCDATAGDAMAEICGDGIDNDCDGVVDNGCVDSDGDGLWDADEKLIGTDPFDADSDDDGVLDGDEPQFAADTDGDGLINALDPDSDGDGIFDGTELGKDCSNPATDLSKHHCIPDADAGATKTDPLLADTDGGGRLDGFEDLNHDGAVDPGERDPLDPLDDGGCESDADCGGPQSGVICDANAQCVVGCRGTGNGCAAGFTCTSTTAAPGDCVTSKGSGAGGGSSGSSLLPGPSADPASAEPTATSAGSSNTSSCEVAWGASNGDTGYLAVLAVSVAVTARRRRRL